jgi:hypothetical protein
MGGKPPRAIAALYVIATPEGRETPTIAVPTRHALG